MWKILFILLFMSIINRHFIYLTIWCIWLQSFTSIYKQHRTCKWKFFDQGCWAIQKELEPLTSHWCYIYLRVITSQCIIVLIFFSQVPIMGKNKRPKNYYIQLGKRQKTHHNVLSPGLTGFLCTCNDRERECVIEAYNILNEYADQMYGKEEILGNDVLHAACHTVILNNWV